MWTIQRKSIKVGDRYVIPFVDRQPYAAFETADELIQALTEWVRMSEDL